LRTPSQYKLGPFPSQHLEGRHTTQIKTDAHIGDFDAFGRIGWHLMRDHHILTHQRMSNEIIVSTLKEGGDSRLLILLLHYPSTHRRELRCRLSVSLYEQIFSLIVNPVG